MPPAAKRARRYNVLPSTQTFLGKTYTDWIEDWTNWFFLPNADQNNSGPVVFLRGTTYSPTDNYMGEGVIMIGNDTLEISTSQRVLLPIITSKAVAESGETTQSLYETVRSDIENGENPPLQTHVRIDNEDIYLPLDDYKFETGVFQINIPSSPYGQSLADYVVPPIKTRDTNLPCVAAGYFVILELEEGDHYILSSVNGSRDQHGLYRASLFYRIVVQPQLGRQSIAGQFPSEISKQLKANFIAALRKKVISGDLSKGEYTDAVTYLK